MANIYSGFYQFAEDPFSLTPDPRFFYTSTAYQEAFMGILYGITQRRGLVSLTGKAGVGKTTLIYKVKESLEPSVRTVFLLNPRVPFEEILECLLQELGVTPRAGKKLSMLQQLYERLLEECQHGNTVVLFIDEAQSIDLPAFEDLRLLSNLETPKTKLLQIVFAGQPEFLARLRDSSLQPLWQRIAVHCRLYPLKDEEVGQYIRNRLEVVGVHDTEFFSQDAVTVIAQFSRGIPRLINLACDHALLTAYSLGKKRIDQGIVEEALSDVIPYFPQLPGNKMVPPQDDTVGKSPLDPPPSTLLRTGFDKGGKRSSTSLTTGSARGDFGRLQPPRQEVFLDAGATHQKEILSALRSFIPSLSALVIFMTIVCTGGYLAYAWLVLPAYQRTTTAQHTKAKEEKGEDFLGKKTPAPQPEGAPDTGQSDGEKALASVREERATITPPKDIIVQPGDGLARIASERYGYVTSTMLDLLRVANPSIRDINHVPVGQRLSFPDLDGAIRIFMEGDGSYSYLLLSTRSRKEALSYRSLLERKGCTSRVIPTSTGSRFYRVLVSGFPSQQMAADEGKNLEQLVTRKPPLQEGERPLCSTQTTNLRDITR